MARILIAEDYVDLHYPMKRFLEEIGGHETFFTINGQEAFDQLMIGNHDLLVTDYSMPIMNGIILVKKIREQNIAIPIIMHSSDRSIKSAALQVGANSFCEKGGLLNELVAEVNRLLIQS